ncbi:DUF3276 family protein [Candidatus Fermentibacteria bacterium]|nr:DUF3276 family protein [Candidatus Fermentibacteria bacterium]
METVRNSVRSGRVSAGSVCYFLDVRQAVNGRYYLVLTESRRKSSEGFEQSRILLFEENLEGFRSELQASLDSMAEAIASRPEGAVSDRRAEVPRAFVKWTEQEESSLRESFASGTSPDRIASKLGRSTRAVEARLAKLGLLDEDDRE